MFSGKRGSLRKVLYKQRNKSDSSTGSVTSQPSPRSQPQSLLTENLVSPTQTAKTQQELPTLFVEGAGQANIMLEDPIYVDRFSSSSASSTTGTTPRSSFSGQRLRANSSTKSSQNPIGETLFEDHVMATPLTVDVNCVCNTSSRPNSSVEYSASGFSTGTLSNRLNPTSGYNSSKSQVCRIPGHDKHHRSISASPQYYYSNGPCNNNKHSMPNSLNAPLLIPLAGASWAKRDSNGLSQPSARVLHHRASLGNGIGNPIFQNSQQPRRSPTNLYLATRNHLDHPTSGFNNHSYLHQMHSGSLIVDSGGGPIGGNTPILMPLNSSRTNNTNPLNNSIPEINKIIFESQEAVYSLFMKAHKCYDLIPTSSKLVINDLPKPAYMDKTPKELGIGSWGDICTISKDTPLIDAMEIFLQKRVSALPLLDQNGRVSYFKLYEIFQVVDIYAKFDAINLAADKTYNNLDETVYEALKHRSEWFEGVRKCSETDNLSTVIDIIVKAEVHRLIVTDSEQRVKGIISLSDILKHLVLDPPQVTSASSMPSTTSASEEIVNDGQDEGDVFLGSDERTPLPDSEKMVF